MNTTIKIFHFHLYCFMKIKFNYLQNYAFHRLWGENKRMKMRDSIITEEAMKEKEKTIMLQGA